LTIIVFNILCSNYSLQQCGCLHVTLAGLLCAAYRPRHRFKAGAINTIHYLLTYSHGRIAYFALTMKHLVSFGRRTCFLYFLLFLFLFKHFWCMQYYRLFNLLFA